MTSRAGWGEFTFQPSPPVSLQSHRALTILGHFVGNLLSVNAGDYSVRYAKDCLEKNKCIFLPKYVQCLTLSLCIFSSTLAADPFTARLFSIYEEVEGEAGPSQVNMQTWTNCLLRAQEEAPT